MPNSVNQTGTNQSPYLVLPAAFVFLSMADRVGLSDVPALGGLLALTVFGCLAVAQRRSSSLSALGWLCAQLVGAWFMERFC